MREQLPIECVQPLEYLGPHFHMSPYDTSFLDANSRFLGSPQASEHFLPSEKTLFGSADGYEYILTYNGRESIRLALESLSLQKEDEIAIYTTTQGPYISGCVTGEVARFCKWSRVLSPKTRAILVIHEFGHSATLPPAWKASGLPILEDGAYALGTQHKESLPSEFSVFSFSKAFPLPFGGLLKTKRKVNASQLTEEATHFLWNALHHYLPTATSAFSKRRECYTRYDEWMSSVGLRPRFELQPETVPYAYVVRMEEERAVRLKPILNGRGVESSVYYGNGGYFLPCHQNLGSAAVEYIFRNFWEACRA